MTKEEKRRYMIGYKNGVDTALEIITEMRFGHLMNIEKAINEAIDREQREVDALPEEE